MKSSLEAELVVLLTYFPLTDKDRERIKDLCPKIKRWDLFNSFATYNIHRPFLLYQMESIGVDHYLPEPYLSEFKNIRDNLRQESQRRLIQAKRCFQKFIDEKVDLVILKGTAMAHSLYHNPFYKKSNDIDILIKKKDLPQIYKIYDQLGLIPFAERIEEDHQTQEKLAWHTPPFVTPDLDLVIGTQWGIKTELGGYRVNYDLLWSRVKPLDFDGLMLKELHPEDHLLHLCLHLGFFKTQLKDLTDIYNFVRGKKNLDWRSFLDLTYAANAQSHVYHALSLSQFLCPEPEVNEIIQKLEHKTWRHYRTGVKKKMISLDDFLLMSVDWVQEVEVAMTHFLGARGPTDKLQSFLRVWKILLLPPTDVVNKLNFDLHPGFFKKFFYRLVTPYRIFRAIAEEISWKLIPLLVLKLFIDLFLAVFYFLIGKKQEKRDAIDYLARKTNKTREEIEKFSKNFC